MKYTAGELAKKLGVSARTVRFYDEKNLLNPCGYSDAGYRIYNDNSAERLQKIKEYYPEIKIPSAGFDIWLETAEKEITQYFTILEVEEQKNDLLVPEEELVFDYISSYSEEAKALISKDKESFLERVRSKMNEEGYFYIHKSTGIVICKLRTL